MDKKIKIQIKNRFTGNIIFEYEKINNNIRETLQEAIKNGANLCGANLCDANLRGADLCDANLRDADSYDADLYDADLRGAVIAYNDDAAGYGRTELLVNKIQANSNLILTNVYENHDSFSSRYGVFWRNLIIIRGWRVKEAQKFNLSDDEKEAISIFAKIHGVSKLAYHEYSSANQHCFSADINDVTDADIEMPGLVSGLEEDKIYTLHELGIK